MLGLIGEDLRGVALLPEGIARHGALVGCFIALSHVLQGVLDAHFDIVGEDGGCPAQASLGAALDHLARAVILSWDSGFRVLPDLSPLPRPATLPQSIEVRPIEGYAFYALYPESYVLAARRLVLKAPPCVIGIRSIGTGLASLVAVALDAPAPVTVRPTGHPFSREIAVADDLAAALTAAPRHFVIVDEGPGLSGSSFAAVAQFLEARGVPPDHIAFLPSHGGEPGAMASPAVRDRWRSATRPVVTMDELIPLPRLADWAASIVGELDALPEDVSGGAWRSHVYAQEAEWPAIDPQRERRKFLVRARGQTWLMKFAGLGTEGSRKLARGRTLAGAGLVPEVAGLVHGFLIERWVDAAPFVASESLAGVARYLGARARLLPPAQSRGASLTMLRDMALHNIEEGMGGELAGMLEAGMANADVLEARCRPMATDNRCDLHEWLRTPDGRLLKADALDHDAGHDLIGPQDLAWDVAGVIAEFDLSADAAGAFIDDVARLAGIDSDRELLNFLRPCYLAFRLGLATEVARTLDGWPAEQARNRQSAADCAGKLTRLIQETT
jgi:hypothetical protein